MKLLSTLFGLLLLIATPAFATPAPVEVSVHNFTGNVTIEREIKTPEFKQPYPQYAQLGLGTGYAMLKPVSSTGGTGTIYMSQWQPNYQYENIGAPTNATDVVYTLSSANATYILVSTGICTSGNSGGPSGTGTYITDGTCQWNYVTFGSQMTIPANYVSTISVEAIAGGGGGSNGVSPGAYSTDGTAGGGGAYAKITSFATTPGAGVYFSAGTPGEGGAGGGTFNAGTNSQAAIFGGTGGSFGSCTAAASVSAPLCADFGVGGNTTNGGTGGLASNSIGTLTYSGGNSGSMPQSGGAGGGGAAGPDGAGQIGGNGSAGPGGGTTPDPGGGGGGADGGSAGQNGLLNATAGGGGGNNFFGSGGGTGATSSVSATNGTNGGGGGGAYSGNPSVAGNGGCGTKFDSLHGPGGGGGGGASFTSGNQTTAGNGSCGAGGGANAPNSTNGAGGNGGYGMLVFKYNCTGCSGNSGNIPTITSITSSCSGTITFTNPPTICVYSVNFSNTVYVGGSQHPRLNLATSPVTSIAYLCDDVDATRTKPTYAQHCGGKGNGSGTSTLYFGHAVWGGQIESTVTTSSSAINLNGATIENLSNSNANLAGANSVSIAGLTYSPGNAWCIVVGGSDSNTGLASTGSASSTCYATLAKAQTEAIASGSNKTIFLRSTGGEFTTTNNPATCNFTTHNAGGSEGLIPNSLICQTVSDNGEVWAAWPGDTPVIDGGCPSSAGNTPVPDISGCVFVAFESGYQNYPYGSYVTGLTRQGLTIQHFYGGGYYDYSPTNLTETDNVFQDLYNTCGSPDNADSSSCNGAGGAMSVWDLWTNYDVSHNLVQRLAGFGINGASGVSGTGSYSMTYSYDLNTVNTICTGNSDCGAIYLGWYDTNNMASFPIGTIQATENMISNVSNGVYACGDSDEALYLDNSTSAALVKGNIVFGIWTNAVQMNDGGQNNLITNNVFDETSCANGQYVYPWYMPGGGVGTGDNQTFSNNVTFNGSGNTPSPQGLMYGGSGDSTFPILGLNWYYTATGAFPYSPYGWIINSSPGLYNTSGVLLSGNPFVNATAGTAAGYQVINSGGGATMLANGWEQIAGNQGPR